MRSCLSATALLTFVGMLFAAPVPKAKQSTTEQLVGVWKLVKTDAEMNGDYTFTIEFTKDGKLLANYDFGNGTTQMMEGTFKAEDDKIVYTLDKRGETLTIEKLSDDELVVIDPEKKKEEFARVKAKK
jgi:uncharacterized protein (TIGR03066 family)